MSEQKKKEGLLKRIGKIAVVVMVVLSLGMSSAAFMSMFGPGQVEAGMTQTQKAIDKLIASIMGSKELTDEQKAMLVQSLRTFSADCIVSMEDASLMIDWLIDSDLLTDDQVALLMNLRKLIDSGDITDVNLVRAILSNVLAELKEYIVGEKSPTYVGLENMCEEIKNDTSLTESQRTQYLDILYAVMSDELALVGLNGDAGYMAVIQTMLDEGLITDPGTESTLQGILNDLKNGKSYDSQIIEEVIKYAFTQMMGDDTLTTSQREVLAELVDAYTNENQGYAAFTESADAIKFMEYIYDSNLVRDANVIRDMETVLTATYEGTDVELDILNDVISRALSDIYASLLSEKIGVLTGKDAPSLEGLNSKEYYEKLIARCTSSRFNYIEAIAHCNRDEIQNLYDAIDQNMILSDNQRITLMQSLNTYQMDNDAAVATLAVELRNLIDENGEMDVQTKAGLITMINSLDDNSRLSMSELEEKLRAKATELSATDNKLALDLEDLQASLEEADKKNLNKLKSDIKKLENNTNDSFDKTALDIAAVRKELAENAGADNATAAALRSDLAALDRHTADAILALANDTDSKLEELRQQTNTRINNLETDTNNRINNLETNTNNRIDTLETDTNNRIDTLESDTNTHFTTLEASVDSRFEQMEEDTDAKIAALRTETNTALALLRTDLEGVEQSVVDTNAAMETMNQTLVARDEDMKTALGASMLASFTNVETFLSTFVNNTDTNFNAMYVELYGKMHQQYTENVTNHNNLKNAMGSQFDYTLDTTGAEPVLTFTPHTEGVVSNYTGTDPGTPTSYTTYVGTDAPSDTYVEPVYTQQ